MFLHTKLENRKDPIKICFIGCGKFVSMFLAQYNHLDKIQIDTIVDINIDQAKKNCLKSGLNEKTVKEINFSSSLDEALNRDIEIFIEATGNPIVGTVHATKIIKNKKHYFYYYGKKVMTYTMVKKSPFKFPTERYLNVVKRGYKDCKLDKKYLKNALTT